jgi:hypothetical protein
MKQIFLLMAVMADEGGDQHLASPLVGQFIWEHQQTKVTLLPLSCMEAIQQVKPFLYI